MSKTWYNSKMLWVNAAGIVAIIAQAQFGFLIDPATQVAILGTINVVLRAITGEAIEWSAPDE